MSVPDKGSFFSRFTMKFLEIFAAGIATAVSGYLIAHIGGFLSTPAWVPAAAPAAPSAAAVSATPHSQPASPARPVSADANAQRAAPEVPAKQSARTTANTAQPAPARKRATSGTNANESKPHEEDAVAAQVRAALANVDANHPAAIEVTPHQADTPPPQPTPPAAAAAAPPAEDQIDTGTIAPPPLSRAAAVAPQPKPQPLLPPDPPTAVEIKSRPVASVDATAEPAPVAQEDAKPEDKGLLSAIKHFPDMLRPAAPAPAGEPPRPPLPVGE